MTTGITRAGRTMLAAAAVLVVGLIGAPGVSAHPLNTSAVRLDVGTSAVGVTVELPLDQLGIARDQELAADNVLSPSTLPALRAYVAAHLSATDDTGLGWTTEVTGGRVERVDGADDLAVDATLTPSGHAVGSFVFHDDVIVDLLPSHRIFVSARYGDTGSYTTLAMLSWQTQAVPVEPAATPASNGAGFLAAVRLGLTHIATGSDHLLFLFMLLLPAPLVARGGRWIPRDGPAWPAARRTVRRVVHVVSAFAVGHSVTLALGALGWFHLPERLVESGIALSVLVSAVHAARPLVRGGEALIGLGFGLLHGLSFAAVLADLQLDRSGLVTTMLGFNLGIEVTQLLVVGLVMPSLLALSTTPAFPRVRLGLAVCGAVLAAGWLAQRTGLLAGNPLEPVGDALVEHSLTVAAALAAFAVVTVVATRRPAAPVAPVAALTAAAANGRTAP